MVKRYATCIARGITKWYENNPIRTLNWTTQEMTRLSSSFNRELQACAFLFAIQGSLRPNGAKCARLWLAVKRRKGKSGIISKQVPKRHRPTIEFQL